MIWLNAPVLFALAALAAPVLIHILVQRRAEHLPFPTLRFLQPTRLAAIRRHVLEDAGLLAIRAAILAAAVAALAGPLVLTPLRRQVWDRRVIRAVVVDDLAPRPAGDAAGGRSAIYRSQQFSGPSLRDAIRRAVVWLETAPPGRRELSIVSPLPIGSLDTADVAAIPASIGIRFERAGELPRTSTIEAGRVMGLEPPLLARAVAFNGAATLVRDAPATDAAPWPIDVVHAPDATAAVDAAKAAVLRQRVRMPLPGRRVRLVIGAASARGPAVENATAIAEPWMADAVARIVRDGELQAAASRITAGLADASFTAAPWQALASAADGRPVAVAANRTIVSAASATDIFTPLLMRAIVNGLAAAPDLQKAEVLPIADRQLQQWSRPSAALGVPSADALRRSDADDDRRWFWIATLCLIAIEGWIRRVRMIAPAEHSAEDARVA